MKATTEQQRESLQNWASKFNCEVKVYQNFDDKRTKPKFVLCQGSKEISNKHDYEGLNTFMLGIDRAKKFNL